jgi:hypothetical protein
MTENPSGTDENGWAITIDPEPSSTTWRAAANSSSPARSSASSIPRRSASSPWDGTAPARWKLR